MIDAINSQQKQAIQNWLGTGSVNIFGPQFAGKDTQGQLLVDAFGGSLIGGGDIIRGSVVPERLMEDVNQGKLIPTKDYIDIVLPYISRPEFADKPLFLSAVGRWKGEEKGVLEVTTKSNHPLKTVVYITLPEEVAWQRWRKKQVRNGGVRQDEDEHALGMRLQEFEQKTLPVIDFYRDEGLLVEVDGRQKQSKVFYDIIEKFVALAQA